MYVNYKIVNDLRAKYPNDDPVPGEGCDHQHGIDECQAEVPVLADRGEVSPVIVD